MAEISLERLTRNRIERWLARCEEPDAVQWLSEEYKAALRLALADLNAEIARHLEWRG
jgi:hypothetical protein